LSYGSDQGCREPSGVYYVLKKETGKQFRRWDNGKRISPTLTRAKVPLSGGPSPLTF